MRIELVEAYAHKDEVKILFDEYTNMLIEGNPDFQKYLAIQNYDEELEHLESKYGFPDGRLYLKRLYVRPQFRGNHIGDYLVKLIIEEARKIGYSHMLLDTLPFLDTAIQMYKKYGFYEIPSYNNSPMEGLVYLKLDIAREEKYNGKI